MDPPLVQINNQPPLIRIPTNLTYNMDSSPPLPEQWPDDSELDLPSIRPLLHDEKTGATTLARAMVRRLNDNKVKFPDSSHKSFWPVKLFDHLFDCDISRLVGELFEKGHLPSHGNMSPSSSLQHWTRVVRGAHDTPISGYRRIFALLILVDKGNHLAEFIKAGVDDSYLPFNTRTVKEPVRGALDAAFPLKEWDSQVKLDLVISKYQWDLTVRYIGLPTASSEVCTVEVDANSIHRPWYRTYPAASTASNIQTDEDTTAHDRTRGGTYGFVHQVKIHPWQHNFNPILESVRRL